MPILSRKGADLEFIIGPKTALSGQKAPSENEMDAEINALPERSPHLFDNHDRLLKHIPQPKASAPVRRQSSFAHDTPLPRADAFQQLNAFAESIKLSSISTMKEDKSRREAEWRARLHQRHLKHRETFPILSEGMEYRAAAAEKMHQDLEDEADRAQKRQEKAVLALASTLQRFPSAESDSLQVDGTTEIASLRTDIQAFKESVMETATTEIGSLRTDLRDTHESLENARREIDYINCNALTEQALERRLQQSVNGLVPWKDHEAVQAKITELTSDLNNRKTEIAELHRFNESVMSQMKQCSSLLDKQRTRLSALTDDIGNETADRKASENSLQELENNVSEYRCSFQAILDSVVSKGERHEKQLEAFKGMADEMSKPQHAQSSTETLNPSQGLGHSQPQEANQSWVSFEELAKAEERFEEGNQKLLQTIRDEQRVVTETFMQEIQETTNALDHHAKLLAELKIDGTAVREAFFRENSSKLSDISKRHSVPSGQQPVTDLGDIPVHQVGATLEKLGEDVKNITAKNAVLEGESRAIGQFVLNQQQKFDRLTTTQLTQNMINFMTKTYPPHPAHVAAQINQIAANHRTTEGAVQGLSNKYAAIENMVRTGFAMELQPLSDKIKESSSSQSKIRQDCMVLHDGVTAEIAKIRAQTQSDVARITSEVSVLRSDIQQLKVRPPVASPTPPSMVSRTASISAGAARHKVDETRASESDSETPLQARNRSVPMRSSTATPTNVHGKRPRKFADLSDEEDDGPLSLSATAKRNKQIRRMNKSSGGMS